MTLSTAQQPPQTKSIYSARTTTIERTAAEAPSASINFTDQIFALYSLVKTQICLARIRMMEAS